MDSFVFLNINLENIFMIITELIPSLLSILNHT